MFETMTYDDWTECTQPKIQGSWNLHNLIPQDLDFFIMLSSISGIIGNPGQANYAAGNTFQDALVHHRRRQGLKAVSLDIGPVEDVGYLAESEESHKYWTTSHLHAMAQLSEDDIHFLVKTAMAGQYTVDDRKVEIEPQIIAGLGGVSMEEQFIARNLSPWARDGKFSILMKASAGKSKRDVSLQAGLDALVKADTFAAAVDIVEKILTRRVAMAVMMPEEDITLSEPLQIYGGEKSSRPFLLSAQESGTGCLRELTTVWKQSTPSWPSKSRPGWPGNSRRRR